jgi:hypothetical protein
MVREHPAGQLDVCLGGAELLLEVLQRVPSPLRG